MFGAAGMIPRPSLKGDDKKQEEEPGSFPLGGMKRETLNKVVFWERLKVRFQVRLRIPPMAGKKGDLRCLSLSIASLPW
jgi:hypothetical protein